MTRLQMIRIALALGATACAATEPTAHAESTPAKKQKAAPPKDAKTLLREAFDAVGKGRLDDAQALLDKARPLVGNDAKLELQATNAAIAILTNRHDYDGAAQAVLATIRKKGGDPKDGDLFFLHNWMAILREAEGDLTGAMIECAERTAIGYEGTWEPSAERLQQARFKDDWHRAYLFRMYAEQQHGSKRDAALLAAEEARKAYASGGGYPDSIAVLDALFAMYDRRWDDVRAAVKRVDLAKDDDEEDLYLLFTALDATGDHEAAAVIRKQIEKEPPYWNVWRTWMKNDTDGTPPAEKPFSPRFPTGK